MKRIRIVDEGLLEQVRQLWCIACGIRPVHAHHVTSRGAGGDDVAENVMPLCPAHHAMWHKVGPTTMVAKYPSVRHWLELAGREDVLTRSRKTS